MDGGETMSKSLEALKNLKATAIETIRALSYPASNLVKEDIEYIEGQATTIEKDLEVLNALKRNVGIRLAIQEWANKESNVFPSDRKIVKEWLENGIK